MAEPFPAVQEVGRVQPVCALVVYETASEIICAASQNVGDFIYGHLPERTVGQSAEAVLGGKLLHELRNAAALPSLSKLPEPLGVFDLGCGPLDALAHASSQYILIEVVPSQSEPTAVRLLKDMTRLAYPVNHAASPLAALTEIAKLLRLMSGYDRVQFAKYSSDDSGRVIVEARQVTIESGLDRLARLPNRRMIPSMQFVVDASTDPNSVLGRLDLGFDMGLCHFAFPSRAELSRLSQTDVKAELAQPLYQDGRLWGQLLFHSKLQHMPSTRFKYIFQSVQPAIQSAVTRLEGSRDLA